MEGEEFTRAEAQTYRQTHADKLQQEVERVFTQQQDNDIHAASTAAVKATVLEQLNTLNRFTSAKNEVDATLIAARMSVRGAQLGLTPEQMYAKQPLNFVAEDVSGGQVFRQVLPNALLDGMELGDANKLAAMYRNEDKTKSVLLGQADSRLIDDGLKENAYLETFSHSGTQSGLNHIRTQHGEGGKELQRGQLPIRDTDIAQIDDIVKNYDAVRFDLVSKTGKPMIAYAKQTYEGALLYFEEAHNKRHDLVAHAMRRYPATSDAVDILHNVPLYVRSDGGHDNSIGRLPKAVNPGPRLAPNGKPSNLNPLQWPQVRTPEFKKWFGDWENDPENASKVIDENGEPLVVYHGSDEGFNTFLKEKIGSNIVLPTGAPRGFYFAKDKALAEKYGKTITEAFISGEPLLINSKIVVAGEPTQIKSALANNVNFDNADPNILNQQQFGSFNPATNTIAIFKQGNLSTVLHELGHFFFENDIALASELLSKAEQLTPGEQAIVNDVSALLSWHGLQGTVNEQVEQWYSMGFEQQRSHHERTAEAFEAYLFTGKAPSI